MSRNQWNIGVQEHYLVFKGPIVFYEESQSSDNEFPYFATKFNARQIMHEKICYGPNS